MAAKERAKTQRRPSGGLTAKSRRKSATIKPDEGHPNGRFPMPDKEHARNALARLNQAKGLSLSEKSEIRARAHKMLGHTTGTSAGKKMK